MKKISFLLSLFIIFYAAKAQTLIPFQSSWKYLDNGTNQGISWESISFNDAAWKTGNGKFGYGITDAGTTINYGPNTNKKYITTYFRKSISITNPSAYAFYTANIKRDDGIIVYVNGSEVYRNNLSAGSISYTTLASESSDNGYTPQTFNINSSFFVSGTNIIAVEIHQAKVNTPDMAFDMELKTPPADLPPSVISINRQSPLNATTNATGLTYRVIFSEKVTGLDYTDLTLVNTDGTINGVISSNAVAAVGTDGTTYDVNISNVSGNGTLRLDLKSSGTGITDITGNPIVGGFTGGQSYVIDQIFPALSSVSIASNNSNPTLATIGNVVTLSFTASEPINTPTVTIQTHSVTPIAGTGNSYIAKYTMASTDSEGIVPFTINCGDIAGNLSTQVATTTNGSSVLFKKNGPVVLSINRQSPIIDTTNVSSVTFRVTFSVKVSGVDRTDFSVVSLSGQVSGTLGNKAVTSVGTTGTTYDVTVSSIKGNGTLRLDLKNSGTNIIDVNGIAISGGFASGETYLIDKTAPSIISINRQSPISSTTNAALLTFRISFSEKVRQVTYTDFTLTNVSGTVTGIIGSNAVVATSIDSTSYDVIISSVSGSGILRLDLKNSNTGITDLAGNTINGGYISGQTYTEDQTPPTFSFVNITSNGSNTSFAKVGDAISLTFTSSEPVAMPIVTIGGHSTTATKGSGNNFSATYIMMDSDAEGTIPFTINFNDLVGNAGIQVDNTTNGSFVSFDKTVPSIISITRQLPYTDTTSAASVTFRAIFSEGIIGIDKTDFALTTTAATTGIISSVVAINTSTYDILVDSVTGNGSLRLDLNSTSTGITDLSGNSIVTGLTDGETYTIESTSSFITNLGYIPTSVNTGEKPQSKVWNYNGYYWAVLPGSNGTYLWRLDGTNWTSILKLSDSVNSHADCKRVGNVTHILLFQGFQGLSAQLVSVEYVPATNTYQLWSTRPSTVEITLDSGVETAVIDIDGRGRMWLASAAGSDINVRWSDAPYSLWSAPITIATGVADDDICDVVYMPRAGQVGVLWSNQNTKRFGFKTHSDGAGPYAWSADEIPASQSAINFGHGMADDHLNFALASDGTLYCSVKTSYDATGYPKLALLIRRPNATWDNLYEVSQTGTRGIALLNEELGKLKIVYTSNENGGDILYKETSTSDISFGPPTTLLQGIYNNATSTKENYNSDIVILAGDTVHSRAASILLTDTRSTSVPTVPVLIAPSNTDLAVIIPSTLKWNPAAGATSYQVQVSVASDFATTVLDQSNILSTFTQVAGLANSSVYYWRVRAINSLGNSEWSAIWNFTTTSGGPLMAQWKMDEGSGSTLIDASEYRNDGETTANPTWSTGRIGQALQLNGTSQYATAPNSESLNPTTAITLTAWIKPEKIATQYIIKKASLNAMDGYELSLSNTGRVFFRINQDSSQNTYRVNSLSPYPTNGNTWVHIAATFDGSVIKIYINGILDSSNTFSTPVQIISNILDIGLGAGPNGGNKFQGAIDDARLYNKALTDSEIFAIASEAPLTIPSLAFPSKDAVGVIINPTSLSWSSMTSPTSPSYQLQVSTTPDFTSTVYDQSNITDTSAEIEGLINYTNYYWRVKSTDERGSSDWSQVWNFKTVSNNPLVAQWKMDEGSGTTLVDVAEYQNNAITAGNPTWTAGKTGLAIQLDGSSTYAKSPNTASLNLTNAITLMAWIKPEKVTTQYVIKKAIQDTTDGYELSLSQNGQVFFRINQKTFQNTFRLNSATLYPSDGKTWMHIAASFDGSSIRLYINGNLEKSLALSTPVTINLNSLDVGIGAESNGGNKFQGAIDDARIYYTALNSSEISNIVSETAPTTPNLLTPTNTGIGVSISPTILSWNTSTGAISYDVQLSSSPDFAITAVEQADISDTTIQINGLENNKPYYWRVKSINGAGISDWSQAWSFTTISDNPLVGQWKMDEGGGTTLIDGSEYGNNGGTINNPVWITGKIGQALQLDGSSQYSTVPNSPSLNPATATTLSAWIKPEQLGTQNIIKKAINGTTDGYELSLSSNGKIFFRINQKTFADVYRINSLTPYPTDGNTWMHIAATYDGRVMKIYINGIENASLTPANPIPINANGLSIGIGAQSDGLSKFKGAIDEVRIYNIALTASDILNMLSETSPVVPVLSSPDNLSSNVMVNPTNLSWDAVSTASSYQVQVSESPDFNTTIFDQNNISLNTVAVPGLSNYSVYYWRVRAFNTIGAGDWSSIWNFKTISNAPLIADWKIDEGSGTILIDGSEYGNNGTTISNPIWVTGKVGQALQLDGVAQYATVPNSSSLNPATAITLSAWINPEQLGTQNIIKKAINGTTDGYELSLSSNGKVFFRINQKTSGDTYRVNSITSYPTNGTTWMHIAATYDGSVMKIYINGVENGSLTPVNPPAISANTLAIGIGAQSDGQSKFKGAIDEVSIYNTALAASDIANLIETTLLTPASIVSALQQPKSNLFAYPNPFISKTTIKFILPGTGDYSLELFDMNGRPIMLLSKGKGTAGQQNSVELSSLKIAKGFYIVKLQTNRNISTLKLLVGD